MKKIVVALAITLSLGAQGLANATTTDASQKAQDPASVATTVSSKAYVPPEGIAFKTDDFVSENIRLTSQWFYAKENEGKKLPTILMAHGWGGIAANFRNDAVDFARHGYLVIVFDYRGWGESDGRVILTEPRPKSDTADNTFTAKVQELRGYVDPWEQVTDWFNAISYIVAQPMVDRDRIGIRGSSFSGGHVIYVAGKDERVKAVVTQVGNMDARQTGANLRILNGMATALATGRAKYPPPLTKLYGDLVGAPIGNSVQRWSPIEVAPNIKQPTLIILAEKEELFPNDKNGLATCEALGGPRKLVMIPGANHYSVYYEARSVAIQSAVDWFDQHLKSAGDARVADTKRGDCKPQ